MRGERFLGYLMTADGEKELSRDADKETLLDALEESMKEIQCLRENVESALRFARFK